MVTNFHIYYAHNCPFFLIFIIHEIMQLKFTSIELIAEKLILIYEVNY